jgi:hypothetical protein
MNKVIKIVQVISILVVAMPILAQQESTKSALRIDLSYYQVNDDLPVLKIQAKTKVGKKFEAVEGIAINVFFNEESSEGFMGQVKTSGKGIAALTLPAKFSEAWRSLSGFTFMATVTSNNQFEDTRTEIEISKARIELSLTEEDSVRTIAAKVMTLAEGEWIVVPDTDLKFVVKRLLSDLPIGDEDVYTTDEDGGASVEFSLNIPGDSRGNIFIGAKIEDNDVYGTIISTKEINWGTPLQQDSNFTKRTLWSTRDKTPWWLLIFPNLIIAGVWGTIFYLVYQLIRIWKLGQTQNI